MKFSKLSTIFFNFFSAQFSCVLDNFILSHRFLRLCLLFPNMFSFCGSVWIISIVLSLSSLTSEKPNQCYQKSSFLFLYFTVVEFALVLFYSFDFSAETTYCSLYFPLNLKLFIISTKSNIWAISSTELLLFLEYGSHFSCLFMSSNFLLNTGHYGCYM